MSRKACCAVIALCSVVPHLWGIASPPLDYHYHRQANTAAIARNFHDDGLPFFHPRIDWDGDDRGRAATELPLYMWLTGLFWPLFGLGDVWGRLLSSAFSALTALALFHFLADGDWLEEEPAFWAACSFGILPVEVYFGRTIQPEAMALFCKVASIWMLDRYLRRDGPRPLFWFLSAAAAAAGIGQKLPYAYMLAVCACLAWARRGKEALRDPGLLAFCPVVLAAVGAWYKFASSGVYVVPTSGGGLLHLLDYGGRLPYFAFYHLFSRFPELTTTYAGLAFFAAGGRELSVRRRLWFFAAWWLLVYVNSVVGGSYAFHHEYIALSFAPINAVFIGAGFFELKKRAAGAGAPRWAKAGLAALVLAMPAHAALRIRRWYRVNFPFALNLGRVAERLSSKDDLFLCNQRASSVYLYFLRRRGWSWDLSEVGVERLSMVDDAIAKGAKFFLTAKEGPFLDPAQPIAARFFRRCPVVYDADGVLVFRLRPGLTSTGPS